MTVRASIRGHSVVYHDRWEYEDGTPIDVERACSHCKRMPVNGHDACLGELPGIMSACCGHGKESGFAIDNHPFVWYI